MSFVSELRRRNVIRVAILYVTGGWVLLQLLGLLLHGEALWIYRFVFGMLVICFPLILVFSWIYEITPEGLRKEHEVRRELSITEQTGRRISRAIVVSLVMGVALMLLRMLTG